jgi:hypothetical protein
MYKIYLREKVSRTEYWSLTIDNTELIAGLLAGGMAILEQINHNINNEPNSFSHNLEYYFDSNIDVSSFCLLSNIAEDEIPDKSVGQIKGDNLGIWMKSSSRFYYNLYVYRTDKFIEGVYSICNAFNIDYLTCIYELPFDANYRQYKLPGYDQQEEQLFIIPHEVEALDELEEEEADNGNLIEWLRKDNVIDDEYNILNGPNDT